MYLEQIDICKLLKHSAVSYILTCKVFANISEQKDSFLEGLEYDLREREGTVMPCFEEHGRIHYSLLGRTEYTS